MIKGNDDIERKPYLGSTEIAEVWLGDIKIYPDNVEPPTPGDYSRQYLTFEALEGGARFSFSRAGLDYSTDDGTTWSSLAQGGYTPSIAIGEKIMFKGQMETASNIGIGQFTSTGRFNIEGNIMSLLFGDDFDEQKDLTGYKYTSVFHNIFKDTDAVYAGNLVLPATALATSCYSGMFDHCESLIAAPALPATTLASNCYESMFYYCTSLDTAPALPATTLAEECYRRMFQSCTSLVNAPVLPATTMVSRCYIDMFQGCRSLVNAPVLPAMTLAESCYYQMFASCTSLTTAPALPATALAPSCYESMFHACTSLVNAPVLSATTLVEECYSNMFYYCTSLADAPALPATQLANNCYDSMFEGCTSLVNAPVLPALILSSYCYYYMFRNCSSLSRIECHALDISASYCTTDWTVGVASQGEFISSYSGWSTGTSGIPTGWTETESVNGYWTSLDEITGCTQKITKMRFVTDTAYDAAPIIAMDRFQFSNVCRYNDPGMTWTFDDIENYADDEGTFTINFVEETYHPINSTYSDKTFSALRSSAASNGVRIYWL